MTDAENRLWREIRRRNLGHRFRRQHPIGPYFADFACVEAMLVIEVDGGQHAETADADGARTSQIEQGGWRVIRFWNNDVFESLEEVISRIVEALASDPHPGLPPERGKVKGS